MSLSRLPIPPFRRIGTRTRTWKFKNCRSSQLNYLIPKIKEGVEPSTYRVKFVALPTELFWQTTRRRNRTSDTQIMVTILHKVAAYSTQLGEHYGAIQKPSSGLSLQVIVFFVQSTCSLSRNRTEPL